MKEIKLEICGRVQGVNFRNMVFVKAKELGLKGFVRNVDDGSVEAVLQGKITKIEELIDWIKDSPGLSHVETVKKEWREANNEYEDFRIIRDSFLKDQAKSFGNLGKSLWK
jgi:acylphosphatase